MPSNPDHVVLTNEDEHKAALLSALLSSGRVTLDWSPPGLGKSYQMARAVVDYVKLDPRKRVLMLCRTHADATEKESMLLDAGLHADQVGRVEKVSAANGCVQPADYQAASELGWSPVHRVCRKAGAHCRLADDCGLLNNNAQAWRRRVVVAQHEHAAQAGFWERAEVESIEVVVFEEDPSEALRPTVELKLVDVRAWEAAMKRIAAGLSRREGTCLRKAKTEPRKSKHHRSRAQSLNLARMRDLPQFEDRLKTVRRAFGRPVGPVRLTSIPALQADLSKALRLAAPTSLRLNIAPAICELPARAILTRTGLRFTVRRNVPLTKTVVVLDATGDSAFLSQIIGRPVRVIGRELGPQPKVVQLVDSMFSKSWFREWEHSQATDRRVARIASQVASLTDRVGAECLGVITHAFVEGRIVTEISRMLPMLEVRSLHFWALRGSNAFKGCDLVCVVGTPYPPEVMTQLRTLALDPSVHDDALVLRLRQVDYEGGFRIWSYPPESRLHEAHLQLVQAELTQALGRGVRGDHVPRHGVWVWSSWPHRYSALAETTRIQAEELYLPPVTTRLRELAVSTLGAMTIEEVRAATGLSKPAATAFRRRLGQAALTEISKARRKALEAHGLPSQEAPCLPERATQLMLNVVQQSGSIRKAARSLECGEKTLRELLSGKRSISWRHLLLFM